MGMAFSWVIIITARPINNNFERSAMRVKKVQRTLLFINESETASDRKSY